MLPVADPWFARIEVEPGIFALFEPHVDGLFRANVHFVKGRDRDLMVDAGLGIGSLRAALAPLLDKPLIIVATHAHIDHTGGLPEFRGSDIRIHPAEAARLRGPRGPAGLRYDRFSESARARFRAAGFGTSEFMIRAVPHAGYDIATHRFAGVEPAGLIDEGDVIDLGSRHFTVLHLPGHTPGCIGLWDASDGVLLSGDAIFDGTPVDGLPESDVSDYRRTMARLRELPVRLLLGGHRAACDGARMREIIAAYLARQV